VAEAVAEAAVAGTEDDNDDDDDDDGNTVVADGAARDEGSVTGVGCSDKDKEEENDDDCFENKTLSDDGDKKMYSRLVRARVERLEDDSTAAPQAPGCNEHVSRKDASIGLIFFVNTLNFLNRLKEECLR